MFDPSKPVEGTQIDAAELRSQFTGLLDLIAAIPAGPAGPQGPPGPVVNTAVVDAVGTNPPGSSASAFAFIDGGGIIHFTFDLPQGNPGEVTQAQLSNELVNAQNNVINQALPLTSNNSNVVTTLDNVLSSADAELLRGKINELINALRR